ncbi:hypothetical protein F8388_005022 [Cannabis sativa]|uniref:RNase H type-1 domain-containing protein n=1 Tax=Cannabis sativa TaxID=3483 RepID=A0A7J6E6C2_CANSA|nr:hypothetical protein F8388_005022 [Cannabis sativa]
MVLNTAASTISLECKLSSWAPLEFLAKAPLFLPLKREFQKISNGFEVNKILGDVSRSIEGGVGGFYDDSVLASRLDVVEALAILYGLLLYARLGYKEVDVESDCNRVVVGLSSKTPFLFKFASAVPRDTTEALAPTEYCDALDYYFMPSSGRINLLPISAERATYADHVLHRMVDPITYAQYAL